MEDSNAYLNIIETAVPAFECHDDFKKLLPELVAPHMREKILSIASNLGIDKRYTVLSNAFEASGGAPAFFQDNKTVTTAERMRAYQEHALPLAKLAIEPLLNQTDRNSITHLILTSCTGFYAPGPDIDIINAFGLAPTVKRTIIGFMGCYAAVPALRTAADIVKANPAARVLVVNLELCSLHFRHNAPLDQLVSFLLFADGCAASIVSAEPGGIKLGEFRSTVLPNSLDHMRWEIGNDGFAMCLDPQIPNMLEQALREDCANILGGKSPEEFSSWAVHPGGKGIVDATQAALSLPDKALISSREVLKNFGNMSSTTIMFVLKNILSRAECVGNGCGMAFGPGLTLESFLYSRENKS